MNTPTASSPRGFRRGFTLIELLVVIAIIAALVAGSFGAFAFAIEKTRFADAQSMARTIANAVDQFQNEYDAMPRPVSAMEGNDCETDTTAAEGLVSILMGIDTGRNPRRVNLLGDHKEAATAGGRRVDGLIREGENNIELVDPWGTPYKVTLDLDGDGRLPNPCIEEANPGSAELHRTVIVYSAGKDRDFGTWKDNVTSWRPR
jgi:prepilin-type N-terminal cleavage/methylation domain-containing protein